MDMLLRQLSIEEIRSLCNRYGVDDKAVEKFLRGIAGVSLETAYGNLRYCRKLHSWNFRTIGAVCDGIVLATTNHW